MFIAAGAYKQRMVQEISVLKQQGPKPGIMQHLLKDLSSLELDILRGYDDLMERTLEISRMSEKDLLDKIRESHYLLTEHTYGTGDVYVDADTVVESMPKWIDMSGHFGWFLRLVNGEFSAWARRFLMQEVRINLWIRHMEQAKKRKHSEKQTHFGQYA